MNRIGDFRVEYVRPTTEQSVGVSFDDYVLFDFEKGYLWMWSRLPRSMQLSVSKSTGTLIIDGIDDMEVI